MLYNIRINLCSESDPYITVISPLWYIELNFVLWLVGVVGYLVIHGS